MGKTHIAIALVYAAALGGHQILFTTAIKLVNCLQSSVDYQTLPEALCTYQKPALLVLDELGYLRLIKAAAIFSSKASTSVMNAVPSS